MRRWSTTARILQIELPVLGMDGYPLHRRGIASGVPGLAFLGMRFQHRMGSALLGGVGEDAAYVAGRIVEHVRALRDAWDTSPGLERAWADGRL